MYNGYKIPFCVMCVHTCVCTVYVNTYTDHLCVLTCLYVSMTFSRHCCLSRSVPVLSRILAKARMNLSLIKLKLFN